jgi:hypothetical protein
MANDVDLDDDEVAEVASRNIGYKQLVVQVPELVLRRLKLQGLVMGKTMNDVVADQLQKYVDGLPKIMIGDKELGANEE